ncbi:MAG: hypothetical protein NTV68_01365 [Methanomicrobiales archaeon]|nr:hypothetical protein [Methanomicrobiales archaeon]
MIEMRGGGPDFGELPVLSRRFRINDFFIWELPLKNQNIIGVRDGMSAIRITPYPRCTHADCLTIS